MLPLLYNILAVFLVTGLGLALSRRGWVSQAFLQEGSKLVIYVFSPALIVFSFIKGFAFSDLLLYIRLPAVAALVILCGYVAAQIVARIMRFEPDTEKTFVFMNTVINYSYLPITIVFLMLGNEGLLLLFIHNIGCSLVHWTLGIRALTGGKRARGALLRDLLTPGVSAIGVGILASFVKDYIPPFVTSSIELVGQMTIPTALLVVGGMIAHLPFHPRENAKPLAALVLTRMVLVPLACVLIINAFNLPDTARKVALIVALMPTASTAAVFVKQYGGSVSFAAQGFIVTTLASLLTLPLFYYWFN